MLKKCVKCGLPETYETIMFDAEGVCNICRQKEFKDQEIDWAARRKALDQLIAEHRGKYEYDCIIPFSGGKDTTFTLLFLMEEYKLKPLAVQFNHGFFRPTVLENNVRTFKRLGVDFLSFTPNWKLVKRVMLEALIRKGDFCWHCHTGIYSFPMHVALKYNTPLVFWGEPAAEYTAYRNYTDNTIEEVNEALFDRQINLGITGEDMAGMIRGDFDLDPRDLVPFTYPKIADLKKLKYKSVRLGSYIPWDVKKQSKLIMDKLGWKGEEVEGMPPTEYPYEKIECSMQGVRDYIKYLKRGYSRVTQMTALDLRNGRIGKEDAEALIKKYEGRKPPSLNLFLEYLDLTEEEFNRIVMKTVVPPHKPEFDKIEWAPKTWDYDKWYRETKEK